MGLEVELYGRNLRPIGVEPASIEANGREVIPPPGTEFYRVYALPIRGAEIYELPNHFSPSIQVWETYVKHDGLSGRPEGVITAPLTRLEADHINYIAERDRRLRPDIFYT